MWRTKPETKDLTGMKPDGKNDSGENISRAKPEFITIKGTGTRFDGIYDIDKLLLKTLAFIVVVCILALIFL